VACHPATIDSANLNSDRNVTTDNNDDSLVWLALFGNPNNTQDPDRHSPCPDGQQPCDDGKNLPTSAEGGLGSLIKFTDEEGVEGFTAVDKDSSLDTKQERVSTYITRMTSVSNLILVCTN